jgi:hypothetical protein
MSNENENSLDEAFDEVINTNDEDFGLNDETFTENEEKVETLDELMSEGEQKSSQSDSKSNQEINFNEQNTKQQSNKSKGNNNSQDLIDANGNVVAKAGAERRFYEENQKLKRERDHFNSTIMPQIKQEYDTMVAKINAYNETFKSMQMGDLSTEDIHLGMELIRQWKQSPKDTINFLLTQAKSYGINVDENGKSDMAAINQMLDQKLQPFLQERELRDRQIQARHNAENIYNNFMSKYPEAKNHVDEIAYLYKRNPNQSLDAIYFQLQNYYLKNNYDFNTPLAEIQKQKQQNKNTFNGINVNQNVKASNIQAPIAKANASFDSIIREAMKSVRK